MANKELNVKELNNINGGELTDNKRWCNKCNCAREYERKTVVEIHTIFGDRVEITRDIDACKVCGNELNEYTYQGNN